MTRHDFAFVISRAMSVIVGLQFVRQAMTLLPGLSLLRSSSNGGPGFLTYFIGDTAVTLAMLGVSVLLWTKPDLFAGKTETQSAELHTGAEFRRTILFALGLFVLISYGSSLGQDVHTSLFPDATIREHVLGPTEVVRDILGAVAGLSLILMNGSTHHTSGQD